MLFFPDYEEPKKKKVNTTILDKAINLAKKNQLPVESISKEVYA